MTPPDGCPTPRYYYDDLPPSVLGDPLVSHYALGLVKQLGSIAMTPETPHIPLLLTEALNQDWEFLSSVAGKTLYPHAGWWRMSRSEMNGLWWGRAVTTAMAASPRPTPSPTCCGELLGRVI